MTDTELNEALARGMGWHIEGDIWWDDGGEAQGYVHSDWNPCSSLDQMHLVETRIIELGVAREYRDILIQMMPEGSDWHFGLIHATARQKALAACKVFKEREGK